MRRIPYLVASSLPILTGLGCLEAPPQPQLDETPAITAAHV